MHRGLAIRKQGKGSFIDKPNYEINFNKLANFKNIHIWPPLKAEHKILKWHLVKPSKEVLSKVKLSNYSRILEIVRLRFHKGESVALDYTYIPEDIIQ